MKTPFIFLQILFLIAVCFDLHSQEIYVSEPDWIYKYDVTKCKKEQVCYLPGSYYNDIAFHPDGSLFAIETSSYGSSTHSYLLKVDLKNCTSSLIDSFPFTSNGLVCDKDGVLYFGLKEFYSYNTSTGEYKYYGSLPAGCACDFIFYNGDLFTSIYDGDKDESNFIKININQPLASTNVFKTISFQGLVGIPISCDSTLIIGGGGGMLDINGNKINGIIDINIETGTGKLLCGLSPFENGSILGASSPLEFLASDPECDLLLDLDRDNSSGAFPYDFRNDSIVCVEDKMTHIVDDDVYIHTSADLDSIRILLKFAYNTTEESIFLQSPLPGVTLIKRSHFDPTQSHYTLILNGDRSDLAHIKALKSLIYENSSSSPLPGERLIIFQAYNAIKNNEARTMIHISALAYSGRDTTITICAQTKLNNVSQTIGGQAGGYWQPPFSANNNYNSDLDLAPIYNYITESDCGLDSAIFNVQKLPARSLDLGNDIALCRAESYTASIATISGDQILWNDGNTQSNRLLTTPGNYIVSVTTSDGCIITDSILISRSYTKIPKTIAVNLCSDQVFNYNGKDYQQGQTITDSISASTGCDTLLTILLNASPTMTLLRDTFTCDNAPIVVMNQAYTVGDTIVTLIPSSAGCDTLVKTVYQAYMLPEFSVTVTDTLLCEGETTLVTSSQPSNIKWSNGSTTNVITLSTGSYEVSFTDDKGCIQVKDFIVRQAPDVPFSVEINMPDCTQNNGSIRLISENAPNDIFININNTPIPQGIIENLPIGSYYIAIEDKYGCISLDTIILTSESDYDVSMADEITVEKMKLVSFMYTDIGGTTDTIIFNPDTNIQYLSDSILIRGIENSIYNITFIDENGCIVTKSLEVNVSIPTSGYELPNIVSTNSTSTQNNLFYLKSEGVTYDLSIYDRWGNQLYNKQKIEGGDATSAWTPEKSKVQPGVYVYFIVIYTPDGEIQKAGTVTVL